ncbi:MAG: methionine--tRNA ligase [Candidatus Hydrogenedentes bacterium]|nr:methionine--tRNA ligase [Candidatus Hydrogenedentota bacterium]
MKILVTSALPYANGHIHLGHIAGAYLPADIYVRYQRLRGRKVLYIGGSDEYGVPITLTALKEGRTPKEVIDFYHNANAKAFERLGISYDIYGRTSWDLHIDTTQSFFRKLYDGGYIFAREMELWYSIKSNRFLPDRYVKGQCPRCGYEDANGDECERCGAQYSAKDLINPKANIPGDNSAPILKTSLHWFLDLPKFKDRLFEWINSHTEWRSNVRGMALSWVSDLRPRCITRDTEWGVPIPLDHPEAKNKRIYVWFDAPIGYVTNTRQWGIDRYNDSHAWEDWWKNKDTKLVHFIGKDNIPFHAVIFPAMLMGQDDYILADNVVGNEYLNIFNRRTGKSEKGSKSKGNMIRVAWALDKLGTIPIRYYLCAIMPESKDSDFDWDEFRNHYNGELCDVVGNFIHRTLTMTVKNFDGKVPTPGELDNADIEMLNAVKEAEESVAESIENFRFRQAQERWVDLGRKANGYFDSKQPWATRKTDVLRTGTTLYVCMQVVKALAILMEPFIPEGSLALAKLINIEIRRQGPEGGNDIWGSISSPLSPGSPLSTPQVLFPKLEQEYIDKLAEEHEQGLAS